MQRTILVTYVKDKTNGVTTEVYGRYDPVALAKQYDIIGTCKRKYKMSDEKFARVAECVGEVK